MRAVVQRVRSASVTVDGDTAAAIDEGLLVLIGVSVGDTDADADALGDKLVGLRIFEDDDGLMNRSVSDIEGAVLLVSQFTLLADLTRGRRPSFIDAAPRDQAEPLVESVSARIAAAGVPVTTGVFGEHMDVRLLNDGPVTVVIDVRGGRVA